MSNTLMLSVSSRIRRLFCFFTVTLALATLGMFAPRSADALSYGTVTFMGIDFDLNIDEVGTSGEYDISLEVDTLGWTGVSTDLLHAVSVKPTSSLDISEVDSGPLPDGTWELLAGQANAKTIVFYNNKNCCENDFVSGSGWYTEARTDAGGLLLGVVDPYTFNWTIDYEDSDLFSPGDTVGLKAIIVKGNDLGEFRTQMSETAVPIPGTFLLFGASFAGFVAWRVREERRRNRQVAA